MRPETSPDDFSGMLASSAIVTGVGGVTSHAAVVARGLGKPAVVGAGNLPNWTIDGELISVDGSRGIVVRGSLPFTRRQDHKEVSIFLKWFGSDTSRIKLGVRADFSAVEREYSANRMLNDFYLSDAMVAVSRGTDLGRKAEALRNRIHRETAEVFAAYLMVAVAGELRHGYVHKYDEDKTLDDQPKGGSWKSQEFEVLHDRFGLKNVRAGKDGRFDAQMSVVNRLRNSDIETQKEFLRLAVPAFNTWDGGSIGGPKWADIAEAALGYLDGKLDDAVFVDRVFDLRHNTGRIFNKHPMLWGTDEDNLLSQLNHKKAAKDIDRLLEGLVLCAGTYEYLPVPCPIRGYVSPDVAAIWEEGEGKLWWKDRKDVQEYRRPAFRPRRSTL